MDGGDVLYPFQCSVIAKSRGGQEDYLILASRDRLYKIEIYSKSLISSWTAAKPGQERLNIILVAASRDGRHIVAVTGEDKTVHVIETENFQQLHKQSMPKRPCAITFSVDGNHILCGDKFGDVYALPTELASDIERPAKRIRTSRSSAPAATNLTVHTMGNLKTLENQLRSSKEANKEGKSRENDDIDPFPYDPILGHVSMLTDIATTRLERVNDGKLSYRSYILTSDRDEHIRISRNIPQAYVIEGFCLGHTQFVNKLCLVREDVLISGGGDDYLCVWLWTESKMLCKLDLLQNTPKCEDLSRFTSTSQLAVSGLWSFSSRPDEVGVVCACEGVPLLWHFQGSEDKHSQKWNFQTTLIPLVGNALSVSLLSNQSQKSKQLVISIDNLHCRGSTLATRDQESYCPRLQIFEASEQNGLVSFIERPQDNAWQTAAACQPPTKISQAQIQAQGKYLSSLLYAAGNLRKRGGDDDD